ncbi:MAG: hypothetical protein ACLU9T_04080 [Blautia faecis]
MLYISSNDKYADCLIDTLLRHIRPEGTAENRFMNNFLLPGLQDRVSRTFSNGGIFADFDPKHVVYVYGRTDHSGITGIGYIL